MRAPRALVYMTIFNGYIDDDLGFTLDFQTDYKKLTP